MLRERSPEHECGARDAGGRFDGREEREVIGDSHPGAKQSDLKRKFVRGHSAAARRRRRDLFSSYGVNSTSIRIVSTFRPSSRIAL